MSQEVRPRAHGRHSVWSTHRRRPVVGSRSLYKQKDQPQQVSRFFIAIDPARVIGLETYYQRIETLSQIMKSFAPLHEDQPVLLPGEVEVRQIKERAASGIPIDPTLLESLQGLARGEAPTVGATV